MAALTAGGTDGDLPEDHSQEAQASGYASHHH